MYPRATRVFSLFNLTDMEEDARLLSQLNDNWVNGPGPQPITCLVGGVHDRDQSTIDKWRGANKIEMRPSITPYVENDALAERQLSELPVSDDCIRSAVQTALARLVEHGFRADEQMGR